MTTRLADFIIRLAEDGAARRAFANSPDALLKGLSAEERDAVRSGDDTRVVELCARRTPAVVGKILGGGQEDAPAPVVGKILGGAQEDTPAPIIGKILGGAQEDGPAPIVGKILGGMQEDDVVVAKILGGFDEDAPRAKRA
jgi:hypothetical protein